MGWIERVETRDRERERVKGRHRKNGDITSDGVEVVNGGGRLPQRASAKAIRSGGTARRCSRTRISPALVAGEVASGNPLPGEKERE